MSIISRRLHCQGGPMSRFQIVIGFRLSCMQTETPPTRPPLPPSSKWLYNINHLVEGGLEYLIKAFFLPFSVSIIISLALFKLGLSFPLCGRCGSLMVSTLGCRKKLFKKDAFVAKRNLYPNSTA